VAWPASWSQDYLATVWIVKELLFWPLFLAVKTDHLEHSSVHRATHYWACEWFSEAFLRTWARKQTNRQKPKEIQIKQGVIFKIFNNHMAGALMNQNKHQWLRSLGWDSGGSCCASCVGRGSWRKPSDHNEGIQGVCGYLSIPWHILVFYDMYQHSYSPSWTFGNLSAGHNPPKAFKITFCNNSSQLGLELLFISDSLWPHGLQHARLPCPSPSPGACSNSCPRVGDTIQSSRPLLSTPPAFYLSQHQGEGQAYQTLWGAGMLLSFLSQRDRHETGVEITALGHPHGTRRSLQLGHIPIEWFLATVQFRGKTFA